MSLRWASKPRNLRFCHDHEYASSEAGRISCLISLTVAYPLHPKTLVTVSRANEWLELKLSVGNFVCIEAVTNAIVLVTSSRCLPFVREGFRDVRATCVGVLGNSGCL